MQLKEKEERGDFEEGMPEKMVRFSTCIIIRAAENNAKLLR